MQTFDIKGDTYKFRFWIFFCNVQKKYKNEMRNEREVPTECDSEQRSEQTFW